MGLPYFVNTDNLGRARLVSGMPQSQIPNGGFEQGMTNWLPDAGPSIVTDPTRAHSGNNYLQISTSVGAEATNAQFVAVSPGQTITFGGWAYRESGTTGLARWKLVTYDANRNPITYPSPSPGDVSTAAWTFQEGTYVIPTGTAFVRLYCEVYQPTAATVARFDDGFLYINGVSVSIVQNLDYLPFGELNSTDSGISTHKFTGDERDAETSLDHTQFRQYTAQLARWMSPDPAGLAAVDPMNPQSWNRYVYVLNNPLNFADPSGMVLCDANVYDYPGCVGGPGDPGVFGGIDDGGLPVGGGDPPLDANAGPGIDGTGLSLIQSSDGSYFSNLIPDFAPTSVYSGLSQTDTLGADSSLGGDLLPNGDVPLNSFAQDVFSNLSARVAPLNKLSDCTGSAY